MEIYRELHEMALTGSEAFVGWSRLFCMPWSLGMAELGGVGASFVREMYCSGKQFHEECVKIMGGIMILYCIWLKIKHEFKLFALQWGTTTNTVLVIKQVTMTMTP